MNRLSGGRRRADVQMHTPDGEADELPDAERIARLWLARSGLGPSWKCLRRR
jgi:hypothetical protein